MGTMNFQMFKLVFEKAEEPEIKLPASIGLSKKQEFKENIYFCFIDYAKAFDCVNHHKLWKILKEMRIPEHLTCLLRNLYAGQEATVRTGHGTTNWFQIGKGVCHLGMVATMTADPKCGTQQVIQLFHIMSWLLFLESTSSTTSSTSYEFNGVIQGLRSRTKHNEKYLRTTGDHFFLRSQFTTETAHQRWIVLFMVHKCVCVCLCVHNFW